MFVRRPKCLWLYSFGKTYRDTAGSTLSDVLSKLSIVPTRYFSTKSTVVLTPQFTAYVIVLTGWLYSSDMCTGSWWLSCWTNQASRFNHDHFEATWLMSTYLITYIWEIPHLVLSKACWFLIPIRGHGHPSRTILSKLSNGPPDLPLQPCSLSFCSPPSCSAWAVSARPHQSSFILAKSFRSTSRY